MAGGLRGCFSWTSLIRRTLLVAAVLLFVCLFFLLKDLHHDSSPTTLTAGGNSVRSFHTATISSLKNALPVNHSIRHVIETESSYKHVPWSDHTTTDPAVLVIYKKKSNPALRLVRRTLEAQRVKHNFYMLSPFRTPVLVRLSASSPFPVGRYSVIIVVDVMDMVLDESVWMLVTDYCRSYKSGMVLVAAGLTKSYSAVLSWQSPTGVHMSVVYPQSNHVHCIRLCNPRHGLLNITKNGGDWTEIRNDSLFIVFNPPSESQSSTRPNFEPIMNLVYTPNNLYTSEELQRPLALVEWEGVDGVRKVYIGAPLTIALTKLVLLDAIRFLSGRSPVLRYPSQDRWILVDIDDTFVAPRGQKMRTTDVQALLSAQKSFRKLVPGFTFNLGFCGYYYGHGLKEEREGDELLVANAEQFWWFGHTYHHIQPHLVSPVELRKMMSKNLEFAKNHSIPAFSNHYSVAPHHSGVYPVYEALYTAWRELWNVTVSSTEEYPHLRPDHRRRGFIHKEVNILPRQTCKLFTHIYNFSFFAGGRNELISFAEGGEVFDSVLNNPVAVFMTHTTNYAMDRVALTLFDHLFKFVNRWTNIKLHAGRPTELAKKYFETFPEDKYPLWTSPCNDHRHLEIWTGRNNCSRLPSMIVLGPQKTGTTALYAFLSLHPDILANHNTPHGFEEIQFFSNNDIYTRGVEWYMSNFPNTRSSAQLLFEKSATYFASPTVPKRIYSLLPKAKLVVILADPIKRAYSWYQHMRAHDDQTALKYNFSEVIRAAEVTTSPKDLLALRNHSLYPGVYHEHIEQWLLHYKYQQMHFIDGNQLVTDPVSVLNNLVRVLKLEKKVDYASMIRYNKRKGYYCVINTKNRDTCLGKGKGRRYPPMSNEDYQYLADYYVAHNRKLFHLLNVLGHKPPSWILGNS